MDVPHAGSVRGSGPRASARPPSALDYITPGGPARAARRAFGATTLIAVTMPTLPLDQTPQSAAVAADRRSEPAGGGLLAEGDPVVDPDAVVSLDAVHRELDVGQGCAVDVLLLRLLGQLVGQVLELGAHPQ